MASILSEEAKLAAGDFKPIETKYETTVFVSNLDYRVTEDTLRQVFSEVTLLLQILELHFIISNIKPVINTFCEGGHL